MRHKFTIKFEVEIDFDHTDMTIEQAVSEVTESMHLPCDDTDNVAIIEHRIISDGRKSVDAKKPFVRLTISNWSANKKFQEATNLHPTHQFDEFFDYDDLDMHDDMATVIRTLGQIDSSSYYFTTEQP